MQNWIWTEKWGMKNMDDLVGGQIRWSTFDSYRQVNSWLRKVASGISRATTLNATLKIFHPLPVILLYNFVKGIQIQF